MVWPRNESWKALAAGERLTLDGRPVVLSTIDCGELVLPSGRLVACDPFTGMEQGGNPTIQVPPGRYPVTVTLADLSGQADGSHISEAYATIVLSPNAEATRRPLPLLQPGEPAPNLAEGEFIGFGVDAGTACFVDDDALVTAMPDADEWNDAVFANDEEEDWFSRMDDPDHIRKGIANIPLPLATDGANIILIHSGWGDGTNPVVGGYDAAGNLVRVHIDFLVLVGADPAPPAEPTA